MSNDVNSTNQNLPTLAYSEVKAALNIRSFKKRWAEQFSKVKFDPTIVKDEAPEFYERVKQSIKYFQKLNGARGWGDDTAENTKKLLEAILYSEQNYQLFLDAGFEFGEINPVDAFGKTVDHLTYKRSAFLTHVFPDYKISVSADQISPDHNYTIDFESLKKTTKKVEKVAKTSKKAAKSTESEVVTVTWFGLPSRIEIRENAHGQGYATFSEAKKQLVAHFTNLRDQAIDESLKNGFANDVKTARGIKKADVITLEMIAKQRESKKASKPETGNYADPATITNTAALKAKLKALRAKFSKLEGQAAEDLEGVISAYNAEVINRTQKPKKSKKATK